MPWSAPESVWKAVTLSTAGVLLLSGCATDGADNDDAEAGETTAEAQTESEPSGGEND